MNSATLKVYAEQIGGHFGVILQKKVKQKYKKNIES